MSTRRSLGAQQFGVFINYAIGWGHSGQVTMSAIGTHSEEEARRLASAAVTEMRLAGAASSIRDVRVLPWMGGGTAGLPVLFEASYYDADQGLTEVEAYAARVHDWHEWADRRNAHSVPRGGWRFSYEGWPDSWGTEPTDCAGCGAQLS